MVEESIVSLRVDKKLHAEMKLHDEINWSAILRKVIIQKVSEMNEINLEKARRAVRLTDRIRKSRIFDRGKSSTEIIREWRNKRK